ncbi:transmembrane and coiled-coil domains-containing protein 7 [Modicella reniformis]|uniref:Transmembrane and coiled-coil domains-containing protein 7 n=1 Tax=Modicella reniformis TaxID=1440133 RepID=A0A9P6J660_9FUNG|nr:transmembrane and coiled-coil domains-containing protein 7 [Modicella reniformis]
MEQHQGERPKSLEAKKGDQNEDPGALNPAGQGSCLVVDAQTHGKVQESQLKDNLRAIHVLVGEKVDIQNIDQVLQQRLKALDSLQRQEPNPEEPKKNITEEISVDSLIKDEDTNGLDKKDTDVRGNFVIQSVNLLVKLEETLLALVRHREINDPNNDQELLGLLDQRMIHTMLEIIVCWGIYPCLLPGVGMPLNRRVRSSIVQKELFMASSRSDQGSSPNKGGVGANMVEAPVDQTELSNHLWNIIEPLARITVAFSPKLTRFTTLGTILTNRHVPDLYAALLQTAYRPLPKPKESSQDVDYAESDPVSSTQPKPRKVTPGSLLSNAPRPSPTDTPPQPTEPVPKTPLSDGSGRERSRQLHQKEESAKLFHELFWKTDAAMSLESLTILLSSSSPTHPTPTWLKSVSGRFLSQILLRPGGVRVVLEYMQGGAETVKLDQLERVARLVTSVPDQMSSVQEYYRMICPELLEILETDLNLVNPDQDRTTDRQNKVTPPSPQLVQMTTFVVGKLLAKNPAICQVEIVSKEVEPLWKWGTRASRKAHVASDTVPSYTAGNFTSRVSNRKVTVVDETAEEDNDDGDDGTGLDPVVSSEYEITKAVLFLHSFLVGNEPSSPLFNAFLAQASQGLYQLFEFLTQVRSVLREKAKEILIVYLRILGPSEAVEVLKAIAMRRRVPVLASKPWQNLVTHEGRRITDLVEMGCAGESYYAPGLTGGAVLRRRSVQDQNAATQLELDVDVFLDFLGELETSGHEGEILGDLYMYLLDEYHAAKARGINAVTPRRMLTMLQLILSMTQKLGPSVMSKVTQIIGLANNILEHQVSANPAEPTEPTEDDDTADSDILGLVLTLLSAILTENEHLSQQDRHLLSLTLIHLKQLSNHPLIEIRRVAHDLQTLIPPRLNDSSTAGSEVRQKTEMEIEMEKYASALAALQDSLLPVRAHGLHILREMVLAKSIVLTQSRGNDSAERELDHALDIFVQHVQEPDSFIYLNAVKGLAALTDAHGPEILRKLMRIYANEDHKQKLDTRLRIGEALVQTVQRCGEALGGYLDALLPGLYKVMNTAIDKKLVEAREEERRKQADKIKSQRSSEALLTPEERQRKWRGEMDRKRANTSRIGQDQHDQKQNEEEEDPIVDEISLIRSSALTILATAAENCPTALLPEMRFLVDWVLSILELDRQTEVRRAATLVMILLFRALGSNSLYRIEGDLLKRAYRTLRYVEQVDEDPLCRAQARAGIADMDAIVKTELNPEANSSSSDNVLGRGRSVATGGVLAGIGITEVRYK